MFARRYFAGRYFPKRYFPASVNTAVTTPHSTPISMDAAISRPLLVGLSLDSAIRTLDNKLTAALDAYVFDGSAVIHLDRLFKAKGAHIRRAKRH